MYVVNSYNSYEHYTTFIYVQTFRDATGNLNSSAGLEEQLLLALKNKQLTTHCTKHKYEMQDTHTTQHAYTNNKTSPAGKCAGPGIACTTTHYNASTHTLLQIYISNTTCYKHVEVGLQKRN